MSANIKVAGKTFNGVETITCKNDQDQNVNFLLQGSIAGGGEILRDNDVTFFDFDGTIVSSYTAEDFSNLTELPENPTHDGLTAQGWNWSLSDAKTYVASYGKLNIGQMYATTSGRTEYDIVISESVGMTATLNNTSGYEKNWGDGTVDNNTSHTYATEGNYTIKLSGTSLPNISNSKKVRAVRIADGVTKIGYNLFDGCRVLSYVTIPQTVQDIRSSAFYNCKLLHYITISKNTTRIRGSAFSASGLINISLSNGITKLEDSSFLASQMYSVTIPNTVTEIEQIALSGSIVRTELIIPSSIISIGANAFASNDWLKVIKIYATTPPTLAATNAIPSSVTKIYIPNGTLANYQGASNWSNFSALFVEMSA